MSSIGAASIGALNLAGSVAGTQRGGVDNDSVTQNAANQKAASDRAEQSARALGDVSEADLSSDRDADGRQPYGRMSRPAEDTGDDHASDRGKRHRVPDALGERGNTLDLQA